MRDIVPKHFGNLSGVSTKRFNENNIESIITASYVHSGGDGESANGDYQNPFFILPEHLAADYRVALFRYLRNWISAKHGHEFKNPALKECFAGVVAKREPLTEIERKNIEFLQKIEKRYAESSKRAWLFVKQNQIPKENTESEQ